MRRRSPERALRLELVRIARLCWERGLLVALDGNLSVRIADDLLLCTPASSHKGMLDPNELIVVDLDGRKRRGRGEPTSELAMHTAIYRARPDVEAVVHAHPPTCIAFTLAGVSLAQCVLPEVVLTLGAEPTLPYATTGTDALAARVGDAVGAHDAVLLDTHGAVCAGPDLLTAFCRLETLEHTATILKEARDLGGYRALPDGEAVRLRRMGLQRYGGPPDAVAQADQPGADLPEACRACSGCGAPSPHGLGKPAGFSVARLTDR